MKKSVKWSRPVMREVPAFILEMREVFRPEIVKVISLPTKKAPE